MTIYRSKPSRIEAVRHAGEFLPLSDFAGDKVKIRPDDGALLLLAGQDGAQGWLPVPVGHWIASNVGDRSDLWPLDPYRMAAKYELDE